MVIAVASRKRNVSAFINKVNSMPAKEVSQELRCMCYILVFAALEFMIETTIKERLQSAAKKHTNSRNYIGKRHVRTLLEGLLENMELDITHNNGIDYGKICTLVGDVAGKSKKDEFKQMVQLPGVGVNDLIESIKRVKIMRHGIAHGLQMPSEVSPNLSELSSDFDLIYVRLISNLDKVLPR